MLTNQYQQYKEQALSTLSQGEILIKLFDETIKQLTIAKLKIPANDLGAVNNALTKCQSIIMTLDSSLDMRFPISSELHEMYLFLNNHISDANIKKDAKLVADCIPLVRDLRNAFDEADKATRKKAAPMPASAMPSVGISSSFGGRAV